MLIAHYQHRLPADYDLDIIRNRTRDRAPVWDSTPELYFKAFLLRERGRFGATANSFSSLYLWQREEALRDWLLRGGYEVVTNSFGRAAIRTFLALETRKGHGRATRFLSRDDVAIPLDVDLTKAFAAETDRVRKIAQQPGVISALTGLDPQNWTFARILLSETEPERNATGLTYQILHLAQPLLSTLPNGDAA